MRGAVEVVMDAGLGNAMFQYAIGPAMVVRYNRPLVLDTSLAFHYPERTFDLPCFRLGEQRVRELPYRLWSARRSVLRGLDRLGLAPIRWVEEPRGDLRFDADVLTTRPPCVLKGYWHSERYFATIETQLREEFAIVRAQDPRSAAWQARVQAVPSIGLHVRRGVRSSRFGLGDRDMSLPPRVAVTVRHGLTYGEDYQHVEDLDLFLRAAAVGILGHVREVLLSRFHEGDVSSIHAEEESSTEARLRIAWLERFHRLHVTASTLAVADVRAFWRSFLGGPPESAPPMPPASSRTRHVSSSDGSDVRSSSPSGVSDAGSPRGRSRCGAP